MIDNSQKKSIYLTRIPGNGAPLIFLHGWGHSGENMRSLAAELTDFDRYIPDLPGFGKSPIPIDAMSVPDYAAAIMAIIEHFNIKPIVVGHSFGGKIAIELASKYPDQIEKIVIIAGAGPITWRARARRAFLWAPRKIAAMLKMRNTKIGRMLQSNDYRNAAPVMKDALILNLQYDATSGAKKVKCPALLIYGSNDKTTPPSVGRKIAKSLPCAQFHMLDGFTHNDILTVGRFQTSKLIKDFVIK